MRTTVRLDDDLLADAKQHAVRAGKTLTAVIEDALRSFLRRGPESRRLPPAQLATFRGRGPQPGVDLDSTASLLDLMEAKHGARRR